MHVMFFTIILNTSRAKRSLPSVVSLYKFPDKAFLLVYISYNLVWGFIKCEIPCESVMGYLVHVLFLKIILYTSCGKRSLPSVVSSYDCLITEKSALVAIKLW